MLIDAKPVASTLPRFSKARQRKAAIAGTPAVSESLLRVRSKLAACISEKGGPEDWSELRSSLREASRVCAELPLGQAKSPLVAEARSLVRALAAAGATEVGLSAQDLAEVRVVVTQDWPGLLAAMLLVPAWELPVVPRLATVPDWLWGEFVAWLFAAPRSFTSPDLTARIAAQRLPHLEDLNDWAGRNVGSATVRAALESYVGALAAVTRSDEGGRRAAELRGQILTRFLTRRDERDFNPVILPRDGRLLRVGFVSRDFGSGPDTFAALASFESLDPAGFEVFLFPLRDSATLEAGYCERRAKAKFVLPSDLADQVKQLRMAQLDVLVFCGDVGAGFDDVTRLALRRLAPLQVVNHRNGLTSGLPEIDLYVSGAQPATPEAASAFSERLGLLRGPAHSFAFPRNLGTDHPACPREALGLPASAIVFAAVITPTGIGFETCRAWAAMLAQTPGSRLAVVLLHPNEQHGYSAARFCLSLSQVFMAAGVDTGRVAVFPATTGDSEQPRNILRVADLFLDSLSGLSPVWVAEALALGLPALVVSQPADADRDAAAHMLYSIALPELIAGSESAYVETGVALALDAARREGLCARLKAALATGPWFFDTLAAGDALGVLLETAYDELAALDRPMFRAGHETLRCFSAENLAEGLDAGFAAQACGDTATAAFEANLALRSDPTNPRARHLRAQVLLVEGKHARAVDYLMAALPHYVGDKEFWFLLAWALQLNRKVPQAIEALESCLRLDGNQVEPLLMMIDLAEGAGASDIAQETLKCLQQIAPHDHRVLAMS
jgi:predicted O-linked N-acetylglucosamine transferase (SPINDLY family)